MIGVITRLEQKNEIPKEIMSISLMVSHVYKTVKLFAHTQCNPRLEKFPSLI
jgi:hypothetical protein